MPSKKNTYTHKQMIMGVGLAALLVTILILLVVQLDTPHSTSNALSAPVQESY